VSAGQRGRGTLSKCDEQRLTQLASRPEKWLDDEKRFPNLETLKYWFSMKLNVYVNNS